MIKLLPVESIICSWYLLGFPCHMVRWWASPQGNLARFLQRFLRSIMATGCVRSICSWDVFLMPLLCPLQCTSQSPFFLARFGCMVVLILLLLQCSDAAAQWLWYLICCLSVCLSVTCDLHSWPGNNILEDGDEGGVTNSIVSLIDCIMFQCASVSLLFYFALCVFLHPRSLPC